MKKCKEIKWLTIFAQPPEGIYRGEILRPPENSVPQTIVLRYQEIGDILRMKQHINGIVSCRNMAFYTPSPLSHISKINLNKIRELVAWV
jgi:hypothetical protein